MKWAMTLAVLFAAVASAADISGSWKGTADTPNGTMERTFNFKVDGNKLTGETSSEMMGKSTITDGKIDGDNVTFTVTMKFQDNEMQVNYKGKVNAKGDEINFHVEAGGGFTLDYVAKRVK